MAKQFVIRRTVEIVRGLGISDLDKTLIKVRCNQSDTESTLNTPTTVVMISSGGIFLHILQGFGGELYGS
jgi:hypothetical protein